MYSRECYRNGNYNCSYTVVRRQSEQQASIGCEVRARDRSVLFADGELAEEKREVELCPVAPPPRRPALFSIPEKWSKKLDEAFATTDDMEWQKATRRRMSEAEKKELVAFLKCLQKFPWKTILGWSLFIPWAVLLIVNLWFELAGSVTLGLFVLIGGLTFFLARHWRHSASADFEEDLQLESVIRADVVAGMHRFLALPEDAQQVELLAGSWAVWTIDGTPAPWRE